MLFFCSYDERYNTSIEFRANGISTARLVKCLNSTERAQRLEDNRGRIIRVTQLETARTPCHCDGILTHEPRVGHLTASCSKNMDPRFYGRPSGGIV